MFLLSSVVDCGGVLDVVGAGVVVDCGGVLDVVGAGVGSTQLAAPAPPTPAVV